ncbi:MAG: PAS domain S-box protein [Bacillota bacterium]|nr:PAS domain S-box protein [Bacillota bacterium]
MAKDPQLKATEAGQASAVSKTGAGGSPAGHIAAEAAPELAVLEAQLDHARQKLRSQIRRTMELEKQLLILSELSAAMTTVRDIRMVLDNAAELVRVAMRVETSAIFSLDLGGRSLSLEASRGLSPRLAEVFVGMILAEEPALAKAAREGTVVDRVLPSDSHPTGTPGYVALAPLALRGTVWGVLCSSSHHHRSFEPGQNELLVAIGNQVSIAVENARLYQSQIGVLRELKQSEERYRGLFENTLDAIWIVGTDKRLLDANASLARMVGATREEIIGEGESFLTGPEKEVAEKARQRLLKDLAGESYDQRVTSRQGREYVLKVTTTALTDDGRIVAFQHIGKDVTQERRMHDNLRYYLQAITRAQEDERLRIARELHDSTAQTLIAVLHRIGTYREDRLHLTMSDSRFLWTLQADIKSALQEVRHFARDLRPAILDDLGLLSAVEWLLEEHEKNHKIKARMRVSGEKRRFLPEVETTLFRIIQEALNNVIRHSRATQVKVNFDLDAEEVRVTVQDNGVGFEVSEPDDLLRSGKLGLAGMSERAQLLGGTVTITSKPGEGTVITGILPIVEGPYVLPGTPGLEDQAG